MTSPEGEKYYGWWKVTDVDEPNSFAFEDGFAADDTVTRCHVRQHLRQRRGATEGARDGHHRGRLVGHGPDRRTRGGLSPEERVTYGPRRCRELTAPLAS